MPTEAIVLAGGFGTRLGELSQSTPKPMLPVNNRPFLEYLLDFLAEQGIRRVVLSVGYLHQVVIDHFGNQYREIELDYAIEDKPLGTGGAIALASTRVQHSSVFVLNGDTLFKPKLKAMAELYQQSGVSMCMALRSVIDVARYGAVSVSDESLVTSVAEKSLSGSGLINGGIYLLNTKNILELMNPAQACSFEQDILPPLIQRGEVAAFVAESAYFIDIGIPDDYRRAQHELRDSSSI